MKEFTDQVVIAFVQRAAEEESDFWRGDGVVLTVEGDAALLNLECDGSILCDWLCLTHPPTGATGLLRWEGTIEMCEGGCHAGGSCDCDPRFYGEWRRLGALDLWTLARPDAPTPPVPRRSTPRLVHVPFYGMLTLVQARDLWKRLGPLWGIRLGLLIYPTEGGIAAEALYDLAKECGWRK